MLTVKDITFEYDNTVVLSGTSFSVNEEDKIGLVGPNGAGKSTLLKILAGVLDPQSGQVLKPNGLNIGYMPQEIDEYVELTSQQFLEEITGVTNAMKAMEEATSAYGADQSSSNQKAFEEAFELVEALGAYTLLDRVGKQLSIVGLKIDVLDKKVGELSGGQKTKLALAAILLAQFDIFLLDEPTNNLDIDGILVLEKFITNSNSGFVIVSHDRKFLRDATTKIAELTSKSTVKMFGLGYDEYVDARRKQHETEIQAFNQFSDEKKRLTEAARAKAQSARAAASGGAGSDNDKIGRNARQEKAVASHARAAASLASRIGKLEEPDKPEKEIDLNFRFQSSTDMPTGTVLEITSAVVNFDSLELGPYNFSLQAGDKVAVIGPNGGGKSALLKMITGKIKPATGNVKLSKTAKIGYIDQNYNFPNPSESVIDNLIEMTDLDRSELYNVLARFNVKKDKADALPGELSPGLRLRALLAGLVSQGTNLLILDEPTNHLDIPASDELQAALNDFNGTLLVATHDRELLDGIDNISTIVVSGGVIISGKEASSYVKRTRG